MINPDLLSQVLAIEAMLEKTTPGPWEAEIDHRPREESVHWSIKTLKRQDGEYPNQWFIAWLCGSLGELPSSRWGEIPIAVWRDQGRRQKGRLVEADAKLIAAAPEKLRLLCHEVRRLLQENEDGEVAHRAGLAQVQWLADQQIERLQSEMARLTRENERFREVYDSTATELADAINEYRDAVMALAQQPTREALDESIFARSVLESAVAASRGPSPAAHQREEV